MSGSFYVCLNRGTTGGSLPFEEFVRLAAQSGFPGCDVEMGYASQHGASKLRDLFASNNLRFGGWGPPVDHRTEPQNRREGLAKLAEQAKVARELNIDSCATWTLPSSPRPFMENWKLHVDGLKPVAQVLADHGLRFGLEFVSPYHLRRMHPHEFIYTPGLMLELADAIGPNVGLLVDCWHAHHAGVPMEQIAQIPAEKIVLCHLNDSPNLPPTKIEDFKRLLPGEGVIDLKGFFGALKQAGYAGPVSLEAFNVVKDLPPVEGAKRAWAATKNVLAESGLA